MGSVADLPSNGLGCLRRLLDVAARAVGDDASQDDILDFWIEYRRCRELLGLQMKAA